MVRTAIAIAALMVSAGGVLAQGDFPPRMRHSSPPITIWRLPTPKRLFNDADTGLPSRHTSQPLVCGRCFSNRASRFSTSCIRSHPNRS